ncbi:hypothetical protein QAD02_017413 [Eretmocerus hayati]|uniref:Uncharacterized protein n=1 Tax=Eretmocerus hayati TaxID=131215 RepID=A0ACC2PDS8_9HYME|nr:hypothetical protein QAD02_017413 [Eretmocerus hayati]
METVRASERKYLRICLKLHSQQGLAKPHYQRLVRVSATGATTAATKGYLPPEHFTYLDHLRLIQDENKIPVIYHVPRHKNNIKVQMTPVPREEFPYSTPIPDKDLNDTSRLREDHWWLSMNSQFVDDTRKRAKKKEKK